MEGMAHPHSPVAAVFGLNLAFGFVFHSVSSLVMLRFRGVNGHISRAE